MTSAERWPKRASETEPLTG